MGVSDCAAVTYGSLPYPHPGVNGSHRHLVDFLAFHFYGNREMGSNSLHREPVACGDAGAHVSYMRRYRAHNCLYFSFVADGAYNDFIAAFFNEYVMVELRVAEILFHPAFGPLYLHEL